MSKASLLKQYEDAKSKAEAELGFITNLIEHLPEGVEPERINTFGYCADATLVLAGSTVEMLKALPPVPTTVVVGDSPTIKPTEMLRDQDRGMRTLAFPIVVRNPGNKKEGPSQARWWAHVGSQLVEIEMPYNPHAIESFMGEDANKWTGDSHSYSTGSTGFCKRRQKTGKDIPVKTPAVRWYDERDVWAKEQGYNAVQMGWLINLVALGRPYAEPSRERSERYARYQWGHFWDKFSDEQAVALKQFALEQQAKVPELITEVNRELETARTWFLNFFGSRGDAGEMSTMELDAFRYLFRKETGLGGSINWVSRKDRGASVEVGYTIELGSMDKPHIRVNCPSNKEQPPIDWRALREFF